MRPDSGLPGDGDGRLPNATGRMLLAEADGIVADEIARALESEGFEVERASDGEAALEAARRGPFDVLILADPLPPRSGTDVLRALRSESRILVVLVGERDSELDRVLGLELGADDYVGKPVSVRELASRVRALLRRRQFDLEENGKLVRQVGDVRVDLARHEVRVDGALIRLTPFEFKIVALLSEEPERPFTRCQIMQHIWDNPYGATEHACDAHISNLRRKLERDPSRPARITTVRGVGYKLTSAGSGSSGHPAANLRQT